MRNATISLTLLILVLAGTHEAFASVKPGNFTGTTDFGDFVFVVNETGTAVTELEYNFSDWTCGIVTRSGTLKISSGSGWTITDNQFSIDITLFFDPFNPSVKETMTFGGTFSDSGDQASGSWESDVRGTTCSGNWEATWSGLVVNTAENPGEVPAQFALEQNYPNPFNPATTIAYAVPFPEYVTLKVFDMLGREVTTLVEEHKRPGQYNVVFDATGLPNGIYLYRIQAGTYTETKRLVLLK